MDTPRFLSLLEARFPAAWAKTLDVLRRGRFELTPYFVAEEFANVTRAAIVARDKETIGAHLDFVEETIPVADAGLLKLIDVAYVENLMWGLDDATKKWGWRHMPERVRGLYAATWRKPV